MKGTFEKAAKIRSDLWLRLDRMTVHLQLGRWAGDALTLAITWPQGVLDEEDSHVAAAQVHGDVRCLRPHKRNVIQLSIRLLRTFTGL